MSDEPFAAAVLKVFKCAIVDAHNAARKNNTAERARFTAVAEALEAAYPREVSAAYAEAGITQS